MAIELKQNLKLSQQLVITPQLQQAIKLLQLSRIELSEMIQNELLENPVLEEMTDSDEDEVPADVAKELEVEADPGETPASADKEQEVMGKEDEIPQSTEIDWDKYSDGYRTTRQEVNYGDDDRPSYENFLTRPATIQEHLEWQLQMVESTDEEQEIVSKMIGYIDENGYLSTTLEEISQKENYSVDVLDDALTLIQEFDPRGVGARDLKECLLLQAKLFGAERPLLEKIIGEYLPLLEKRDYPSLAKKLKVSLEKIKQMAGIISEMEPKPGRAFGKNDTQYITPDVYIIKVGKEFTVVLNEEGMPRLKLSPFYQNMLRDQKNEANAKDYVQDKLKSAMWLIKSIHQRQRTLYRVSKCIVKFQQQFFEKGVSAMKPMILKDVAEEIGVHESTVSRATSNKYMHTPQGIFELKYFFNSGVSSTNGGDDMASEAVKDKIRAIIAGENLKHPLSDQEIADILKSAQVDIARRTVAKYREMMKILPSSKRKQLY